MTAVARNSPPAPPGKPEPGPARPGQLELELDSPAEFRWAAATANLNFRVSESTVSIHVVA